MGININFIDAFDELDVWVKDVKTTVIRQATRRALTRASRTTLKEVVKAIKLERNMKPSEIKRKGTKLFKDLSGKDPFKYSATVRVSARSISMINFVRGSKTPKSSKGKKVKRRRKVRLQVKPGITRTERHAFIVRMPNGKAHVMKRSDSKSFPIKRQSVPGVAKLFSEEPLKTNIQNRVGKQLQKEFVSNLRFYIKRSIDKAKSRMT